MPFNFSDLSFNSNPFIGFGIIGDNALALASALCDALESGKESISVKHIADDLSLFNVESFPSVFFKNYKSSEGDINYEIFRSFLRNAIIDKKTGDDEDEESRQSNDAKVKSIKGNLLMRSDFLPVLKICLPLLEEIEEYELCARVHSHITE